MITIPGVADIGSTLKDMVRVLNNIATALTASIASVSGNNIFTGQNAFAQPIQLAVSTAGDLPAVTLANVGSIAFASDGRNTAEGGGAGTGCLVQVQDKAGVATWCAVWAGVQVTT